MFWRSPSKTARRWIYLQEHLLPRPGAVPRRRQPGAGSLVLSAGGKDWARGKQASETGPRGLLVLASEEQQFMMEACVLREKLATSSEGSLAGSSRTAGRRSAATSGSCELGRTQSGLGVKGAGRRVQHRLLHLPAAGP